MERTLLLTAFSDFGLADPIARALAEENYVTPTPIQSQTIPLGLAGRDIVGIAQTGTGKTAAFALPILNRILDDRTRPQAKHCRALILSPTRELSGQILDSFDSYGRHIHLSSALAIGGVPMGRQVRALMQGVEVLVATPGRLLDLVQGNALKLAGVEFLVLDEADRMLDMGFINDIRKIIAKLPAKRQTMFFSATMPKAIAELAEAMLRDPARVAVTPVSSTAERISQRIIQVDHSAKAATLAKLLADEPIDRALVFTRTKHGADKVVKSLAKAGISANAIHGNKSQNHRERVLSQFRSGEVRTLIATDIAARGIDVDGISHVVNFDLPNVPETYVHRIGRTARAGREGIAISLVAGADELSYLRDIERLIRLAPPREDRRSGPADPRGAAPPVAAGSSGRGDRRGRAHPSAREPSRQETPWSSEAEQIAKGPRRRRRGGGKSGALPSHRQEQPRAARGGHEADRTGNANGGKLDRRGFEGKGVDTRRGDGFEGKGLAFLHREIRRNDHRKRDSRPH